MMLSSGKIRLFRFRGQQFISVPAHAVGDAKHYQALDVAVRGRASGIFVSGALTVAKRIG